MSWEEEQRKTAKELAERLEPIAHRAGWHSLTEVQKTDAVKGFLEEIERFAISNVENRPISRAEYQDDLATGNALDDDQPDEEIPT